MKKFAVAFFQFTLIALAASPALAEDGASGFTDKGLVALAAGLTMALSAFGGALGQSRAASTALEGMARNPSAAGQIQTAMIIGLALIESLVIYGLVIAFFLQGKI
ncbi:MAG: ATP synthase F0 subunit C [Bdellovibrionota bacterium]